MRKNFIFMMEAIKHNGGLDELFSHSMEWYLRCLQEFKNTKALPHKKDDIKSLQRMKVGEIYCVKLSREFLGSEQFKLIAPVGFGDNNIECIDLNNLNENTKAEILTYITGVDGQLNNAKAIEKFSTILKRLGKSMILTLTPPQVFDPIIRVSPSHYHYVMVIGLKNKMRMQ